MRRATWLLLAVLVPGCAGPGPATETSTFERIQTQIFDVSCSSSSCHSSVGRAANLILETGSSYNLLVNQTPSNAVAAQQRLMRVMPDQPDRSFLMAKLADNLSAGEGVSMPYGAAGLDPSVIQVVHAWIMAGAPPDGMVPGDDGQPLDGGGATPGTIYLPPPANGIQLHVTTAPIPKGTENTSCHYLKLPSDIDIEVNRFQIAVSGGSHHIHLYRAYDPTMDVPDGSADCNFAVNFDQWELVVAAQVRHSDWELPPEVAYHFHAHEQVLMQTHFVNVGSLETDGPGQVLMNLNTTDPATVTAHAGAIFGQDKDVSVPPGTSMDSANCVFPNAINLMAQTGHYHFRGHEFTTYLWDDMNQVRGAKIYDYLGYDDPPFTQYDPPLSLAAGAGLQWQCEWINPTDMTFTFGPYTDKNEHCNLFGFYYPTVTDNEAITCVKLKGVSTTTVRHSQ